MSHFNSKLKKDPFKVINNSYDIEEVYSATLEVIFSEKTGPYECKIQGIEFIKQIYDSICKTSHQNKMEIYPFLEKIRDEKSFEILENKSTLSALKAICFYHYKWIRNPKDWKKTSRNPYKQIESLINFLFCKHSVPVFLYQVWYKSNNELEKKWFFHLAEGKSGKDLPGLYFGWTKKMAHEFIKTKEELEPIEVIIKCISKIHGGTISLFPYLYRSSRIRDGILSSKIGVSEFWVQFIEYFSKQGMFDPVHISHIADYVYSIKFDVSLGRNPEKPNFDIRKKNLQTLMNEAEEWTEQLNRLARAAGMARRVQNNIDTTKRQVQYLETSWAASNWAKNWSYNRRVKVAEKKYIEIKYKMVELCNGAQLLEEGRAMNHCVFSYIGACKSGVCRIFSLRDFTTKSTALTIEVRGNIITQVRGKGNRSMTSEEKTVVADWASKAGCTLSKYH